MLHESAFSWLLTCACFLNVYFVISLWILPGRIVHLSGKVTRAIHDHFRTLPRLLDPQVVLQSCRYEELQLFAPKTELWCEENCFKRAERVDLNRHRAQS